ncbi:MAG: undecaprenyldiphospho-muramoylpentapeptide beta-N-acetylglucosaminyltransferase [Defluviitaleaceae bacterium]|nr:undecaprenyldiphospho-muramoylpentapeptide beta-N-acetylglucosaminyltransferase [Defluviitaleaceae bacterium]
MKKIILTGGGTAGHVMPNLALLPYLKERGFEVFYIGAEKSIEQELAEKHGIPFHSIRTGKMRRDKILSVKNFKDAFGFVGGIRDAKDIIKKIRPDVIFSKGGFVGLPVAMAARRCRVPLILHESDLTSGLANRLSIRYAKRICVSFPETLKELPAEKAVFTGNPIRQELYKGDTSKARKLCGFADNKPIALIMGGSSGSELLNNVVLEALPLLLPKFNIIHLAGKGKLGGAQLKYGYKAFEFLTDEMPDMLAAADIIVSRAGANAINEFLALRKPALLIPLARATRGDQIDNAKSFAARGFAKILSEADLNVDTLTNEIEILFAEKDKYVSNMINSPLFDTNNEVMEIILSVVTCASAAN